MSRDTEPVVVTVTFLCTDIVGSTRHWQENGARMRERLAWHDATVVALAESYGGDVFKARGDGFFVAFPTALRARDMATTLQLALHTQFGDAFQIRTVLASGEAQHRDGDYFGLALSRAARVLELSHGQQLVLTEATARLVQEAEPRTASLLKDLGSHPLRSLELPERLFQYTIPELPTDFPELTHGLLPPHNLPRTLTTFIGRERECAEVERLLATTRLLTVLGAGGSGKTRLSLRLGDELLLEYPDGVWFVDLAPVADDSLLPRAVAAALRVREETGGDVVSAILTHLKSRKVLLILDNCEHLVAAVAQFVEMVLSQCPDITVFATSREALELYGETAWPLPGLSLPPERVVQPARLLRYEAIVLFVERATASSPKFRLTLANGPCVARICRRLDGVPLALELAAAWMSVLSPEQIEQRLETRFKFLTKGSRNALPRHQTLKGALDWSHELLTDNEQVLWRRLSVFAGGFTLEAAEAVCADETLPTDAVLEAVFGLVRKSILLRDSHSDDRYRLLETIREYGLERLKAAEELPAFRLRHLEHFTALAEEAEPHLRGSDQKAWLDRLEVEHPNLRAALGAPEDNELALRLASASLWFWLVRGYAREGQHFLTSLVNHTAVVSLPVRAKSYRAIGILAGQLHNFETADAALNNAYQIYSDLEIHHEAATTLANIGINYSSSGNFESAIESLEKSLDYFKSKNDIERIILIVLNIAAFHLKIECPEEAVISLQQIHHHILKTPDSNNSLIYFMNLGMAKCMTKNYTESIKNITNAIKIAKIIGNELLYARMLWVITECLHNRLSSTDVIAPLLGKIDSLLAQNCEPLDKKSTQCYNLLLKELKQNLKDDYHAALAHGADLSIDQVVDYVSDQNSKLS